MKISLSTRPQDVIATLEREWQMAVDAYIKNEGGKKEYDRKQDGYLAVAEKAKENFIPARFFWQSPDDNKWCVFEHTTFDSGYAYTCSYAFCYYLTTGFGGIFFKGDHVNRLTGEKGVGYVCYESHFFERLHERGIYEWKGVDTLVQFIADNHGNTLYGTEAGSHKCDIRIGSAIGRGFRHKDFPDAYYIKTVLSDEQLTRHQRKSTALGRRLGDSFNKYQDLPIEAIVERQKARATISFVNGNGDEYIQELIRDAARILGLSQKNAQAYYYLLSWMEALVFAAKPSLGNKMKPECSVLLGNKALEIVKTCDVADLDFPELNRLVCAVVSDVSKQVGWNLSRGAVLRCSFNMVKNAKKNEEKQQENKA